ncbi:MAG: RNA polymerase factor sigma-54 [Aeromonadales bacterium]|nr:RNA polymerase factor sigma-54 [Aeromonadales bacterium]MDY2891901.1 RNA polymerase factor sigma-54 [Succinivibrio sp.]
MAGFNNSMQLVQNQSQRLVMTPQMQQAIKLLHLPTLELAQEIEQKAEMNPLLKVVGDEGSSTPIPDDQDDGTSSFNPFDDDSSVKAQQVSSDLSDSTPLMNFSSESPKQVAAEGMHDTDSLSAGTRRSQGPVTDTPYEGHTTESLRDHLMWQLNLSPLEGRDRAIAEAIIDGIDDSGYLKEPLSDIATAAGASYAAITEDDVQSVLKLVQHYDPLAVGSRSVQECLQIQLEAKDPSPARDNALRIVSSYLRELSVRDFRTLCSKLHVKEPQLKEALDLIQSLNPRPWTYSNREKSDFIIPEVRVVKEGGKYVAHLIDGVLPRVRFDKKIMEMASKVTNERDRAFFKNCEQDARSLLNSIEQRNSTLLKVASAIVEGQQDFMARGESGMHPMILNDVADKVGLSESTVSRITTGKYMSTPRGTYELKYFFSSSLGSESGDAVSSTAIRARIKELVGSENPVKPLSDSKIADILSKEGFQVARRTVAKYRDVLGIASSSQRKRLG